MNMMYGNPNHLRRDARATMADARAILDRCLFEKRNPSPEELRKVNKLEAESDRLVEQAEAAEARHQGSGFQSGYMPFPSRSTHGPFADLGEQIQSVIRSALPGGETDQRLFEIRAASGLSEAVPSEGGFLVQKDLASTILQKVYNTGQILQRCRRIPVSGNANGVKLPGVDETSRANVRIPADADRASGVKAITIPG